MQPNLAELTKQLAEAKKQLREGKNLLVLMNNANDIIAADDDVTAKLISLGLTHEQASELQESDTNGRVGFPDYKIKEVETSNKQLEETINALTAQANETVETKVEEHIKGKQKGKEFKDTAIVGYTRKYSAAYDLITMADLSKIEADNVVAYKLVEKSKIWPPYNVEQLKTDGNSAGAAYLKVKTREVLGNRPLDTPLARQVYVKNVEKLIGRLNLAKTVDGVQIVLKDFANLDAFDFIDLSGTNLNPISYIRTTYTGNLLKYSPPSVEKYFEEIFGKMFYKFCHAKGENNAKMHVEALLYQEFTQVEQNTYIALREEGMNIRLGKYGSILKAIDGETDEDKLRMIVRGIDESYYGKYSAEAIRQYYNNLIEGAQNTLSKLKNNVPKPFTVRENDWSWSGIKEKGEKVTVDQLDKIAKGPQSILEKYGFTDKKAMKRLPLAFIKRTGGIDVGEISTKEVQSRFGFRNVIYGNYVNDTESREHTRHFIGAMLDLHEIMNLDIRKLNQMGGLDINFGATGCGAFSNAMACYMPDKKAINITKKRGDGSIAHEWAHYFDNVLAEGDVRGATGRKYATERKGVFKNDQVIEQLFREFYTWLKEGGKEREVTVIFYPQRKNMYRLFGATVEEAIAEAQRRYPVYAKYDSAFDRSVIAYYGYLAYKLNNGEPIEVKMKTKSTQFWYTSSLGGDSYWTDIVEIFARAFETTIADMLAAKNRVSNYLVDVSHGMGALWNLIPDEEKPYPYLPEEKEYLKNWFTRLFAAVRTQYGIEPFSWDEAKRTDEYLEFEKNEKNDIVDVGVIVESSTGRATAVIEDGALKETGHKYERVKKDGITVYRLLLNGQKSELFIGPSGVFGRTKISKMPANGWATAKGFTGEYEPLQFFTKLELAKAGLMEYNLKLQEDPNYKLSPEPVVPAVVIHIDTIPEEKPETIIKTPMEKPENYKLIENLKYLRQSLQDYANDPSDASEVTEFIYRDVTGNVLVIKDLNQWDWKSFERAWDIIQAEAPELKEDRSQMVNSRFADEFESARKMLIKNPEYPSSKELTWAEIAKMPKEDFIYKVHHETMPDEAGTGMYYAGKDDILHFDIHNRDVIIDEVYEIAKEKSGIKEEKPVEIIQNTDEEVQEMENVGNELPEEIEEGLTKLWEQQTIEKYIENLPPQVKKLFSYLRKNDDSSSTSMSVKYDNRDVKDFFYYGYRALHGRQYGDNDIDFKDIFVKKFSENALKQIESMPERDVMRLKNGAGLTINKDPFTGKLTRISFFFPQVFSGIKENVAAYVIALDKPASERNSGENLLITAIRSTLGLHPLQLTVLPVIPAEEPKKEPEKGPEIDSEEYWRDMPKPLAKDAAEYWGNRKMAWNKREIGLSEQDLEQLTRVQQFINKYHPEFNYLLTNQPVPDVQIPEQDPVITMPTRADYEASLEGAQVMLLTVTGEKKKEWQDYADGLEAMLELMDK